ncbi:hypothetical protein WJX74_007673 [Apatococcus lobatus]|uniref:2-phytyl-1,4-beta-naphthoquinone methyltransferase, chloroplastic n=1 Tax=Apatococcus lobatus TaxID=904363 RepID=A0AAW1QHC5_9CHLO
MLCWAWQHTNVHAALQNSGPDAEAVGTLPKLQSGRPQERSALRPRQSSIPHRGRQVFARAVSGRATSEARQPPDTSQDAATRKQMFNRIAPVYDQMNNVLSLGQHWVWKQMAVKWSRAGGGQRVLDVCTGSGDIAFLLAQAVGPTGEVVGLDFAQDMLDDAAGREEDRVLSVSERSAPMQWVPGDALQLPFDDSSFGAATMGYGLRNVTDIPRALRELYRVLEPGASVAVLDFNNNPNPLVDGFQEFALANAVVPLARAFDVAEDYEYLRPSIKRFPTGYQQEQLAYQAGFAMAVHYSIGFGLMGCLVATKSSS